MDTISLDSSLVGVPLLALFDIPVVLGKHQQWRRAPEHNDVRSTPAIAIRIHRSVRSYFPLIGPLITPRYRAIQYGSSQVSPALIKLFPSPSESNLNTCALWRS